MRDLYTAWIVIEEAIHKIQGHVGLMGDLDNE